jgi:hypothetical protein
MAPQQNRFNSAPPPQVHSESYSRGSARKPRGGMAAPINRDHLDRAGPWLRLVAGLALIAYTSYTTITGIGEDFAPILKGSLYGTVSMQLVAGVSAALLISLVEWLTSESYPIIYAVFLMIDARYTQRQIEPSIAALAEYHLRGLASLVPTVVSFVASWGVSLVAARYGEILLFGKRTRRE